jgi:hypothetical protein
MRVECRSPQASNTGAKVRLILFYVMNRPLCMILFACP